jgi:hypothetical protein
MMVRVLTLSLLAGLAIGMVFGYVSPVEAGKDNQTTAAGAGKKKKNQTPAARVVLGTIQSAEEGKSLSVTTLASKKKKQAAKAELKINDLSKIEYVGISDRNEQKLQAGYFVMVLLDPNNQDTAASIKVCKAPTAAKKTKKNKNKT